MAGIGFVLRRLTQRDDLLGLAQGYLLSALVSSGPWLLTVLAIAGVNLIGTAVAGIAQVEQFRIVIIYNFGFSLLFSGPVLLVGTRYLADRIFTRDVSDAPSMFLGAYALIVATQAPIVLAFYLWYVQTDDLVRLGAITNYFLVAALWLVTIFLSALKDYRTIAAAFALGMVVAIGSTAWAGKAFGAAGLCFSFSAGLAVIVFLMVARLWAEYPYGFNRPWAFLRYFGRFKALAAIGFFANAAAWIDKWIMWAAPERSWPAHGMVSYPAYDSAMFLAYLVIVPTLALFIVQVETEFFEQYKRFYDAIQRHATRAQIRENQRAIIGTVIRASRNLIILQVVLCGLVILLSPEIFSGLGISFNQIGMFRIGVLGAMFHGLIMFACILLAYFDLRRDMLMVNLIFFGLNAAFTVVTLNLGFPYYGYGYFLAALATFLFAYGLVARRLADLPYLTFVKQNQSVSS
jgi:uncharacterized membrane protein